MNNLESNQGWPETVLLASPRGFCAGVNRAIETLNRVQQQTSPNTTYCYHEIIHNTHVVQGFKEKGVVFIDNLLDAPENSTLVFSAHGVSPETRALAQARNLTTIDVTCPFVEKTHREVIKFAKTGHTILYIGHPNHDEAIGTIGEAPESIVVIQNANDIDRIEVKNPKKLALITQTTLSFDDIAQTKLAVKERFPEIIEPSQSDICWASQNRQRGIKALVENGAEAIVVIGSPTSSNSKRLREIAHTHNIEACLIDSLAEIQPELFRGTNRIGITSGASAPEHITQEVIDWFMQQGSRNIQEVMIADESKLSFTLPQLPGITI